MAQDRESGFAPLPSFPEDAAPRQALRQEASPRRLHSIRSPAMDRRTVRGRHPQRSRGRLAGVSSVWRTGPWGPPLAAEITPLPGSTATPSTSLFIATHFAPRRRRVPFLPRGSRGHRHGSTSPPGHRGPPRIAALRRRVATLPRSFGRDVSAVSWRTRYPGRKKDIYGRRARRKGGSRPVNAKDPAARHQCSAWNGSETTV